MTLHMLYICFIYVVYRLYICICVYILHMLYYFVDFMMEFGGKLLGKTTVLCKDTPAFIANRVGVFAIQELFHIVDELNLSVTEIDSLTGPIMGRPKSATFRTCDVVGLDTLIHVANGLKENSPSGIEK